MTTIDLLERTSNGKVRNLSGKEAGESARAFYKLDTLDGVNGNIEVLIPDFLYNISPSFFCGMFGKSYLVLGPDQLLHHYRFDKAPEFIWDQINHGMELCATEVPS